MAEKDAHTDAWIAEKPCPQQWRNMPLRMPGLQKKNLMLQGEDFLDLHPPASVQAGVSQAHGA